jgi:RNA-directed DNA polymerase
MSAFVYVSAHLGPTRHLTGSTLPGKPQYYGAFGLKELYPLLQRINYYLVRWLRKKYRRLSTWKKLRMCWERITSQYPATFVHWRQVKWYWRTG